MAEIAERLGNLDALLHLLLEERRERLTIPKDLKAKQQLMRALMNVRMPLPASEKLLRMQDRELQWQLEDKGIVKPTATGIQEWQGDITRLQVDAIVNAANSEMLGCFIPLHNCIDNAIHSAAGIQLRLACNELMKKQGREEETGKGMITPAFNLPSEYVIHTVGPIIPDGKPTEEQEEQLRSCYRRCLELADQHHLQSIAFCCISTGVFRFPNQRAAEIAVETVRQFDKYSLKTIIFNTFKDEDHKIYRQLLHED